MRQQRHAFVRTGIVPSLTKEHVLPDRHRGSIRVLRELIGLGVIVNADVGQAVPETRLEHALGGWLEGLTSGAGKDGSGFFLVVFLGTVDAKAFTFHAVLPVR
jgi:hypothetical protein